MKAGCILKAESCQGLDSVRAVHPALSGSQGTEGEGRNTPMKAKTGSQGDKDMLSLTKVLFKIFESISKIRFYLKIQISGFFWNLKDLGTQVVFFQNGS